MKIKRISKQEIKYFNPGDEIYVPVDDNGFIDFCLKHDDQISEVERVSRWKFIAWYIRLDSIFLLLSFNDTETQIFFHTDKFPNDYLPSFVEDINYLKIDLSQFNLEVTITLQLNAVCVIDQQKSLKNGMNCCDLFCKEYYPMAEPNLSDGRFACYRCRTGSSGWKYKDLFIG